MRWSFPRAVLGLSSKMRRVVSFGVRCCSPLIADNFRVMVSFGRWMSHISLVAVAEVSVPAERWTHVSELENVGGTEQGAACLAASPLPWLKTLIFLAAKHLPLVIAKCGYLCNSNNRKYMKYGPFLCARVGTFISLW